jgi:hypothetical protein
MSTSSNPQMTAVLVNVSRNRIATQNDIAKSDIINCLNTFLLSNMDKVSEEYVRHFEKHLEAITTKLGAPELREAYVPKQKFVFAE